MDFSNAKTTRSVARRGGSSAGSRVSSAAAASRVEEDSRADQRTDAQRAGLTGCAVVLRAGDRVGNAEPVSEEDDARSFASVASSIRGKRPLGSSSDEEETPEASMRARARAEFLRPPPPSASVLSPSETDGEGKGAKTKKRKRDNLPSRESVMEDMVGLDTAGLGTEVLRQVGQIVKVADSSGHLKGTYVRALKMAARIVEVAVTEMQQRSVVTAGSRQLEQSNHRLTAEAQQYREENEALRAENEALRRRGSSVRSRVAPRGEVQEGVVRLDAEQDKVAEARPAPSPVVLKSGHASVNDVTRDEEVAGITVAARLATVMEERFCQLKHELTEMCRSFATMGVGNVSSGPMSVRQQGQPAAPLEENPAPIAGGTWTAVQGGGKAKGKKKSTKVPAAMNTTTAHRAAEPMPEAAGVVAGLPPTNIQARMEFLAQRQRAAAAPTTGEKVGYAAAVGRKAATVQPPRPVAPAPSRQPQQPAPEPAARKSAAQRGGTAKKAPKRPARPPGRAAVALNIEEGTQATYAEVMRAAREKVALADLGITEIIPKRAVTGGMLLEVPGPESAQKAEALASRMREALAGMGVKVSRPIKRAELRVTGLDDSVTPAEVAACVAAGGECPEGEVKVGDIRHSPSGMGTVWVRCPLTAARKITAVGTLRVGWVQARVESLQPRPLQCYRCLETGHVRQRCTATVDRSGRCYVCGAAGHLAGACTADRPRCPLCKDLGRPDGHRLGGAGCAPPPPRKGRARPARVTLSAAAPAAVSGAVVPPVSAPSQGGSEVMAAVEAPSSAVGRDSPE